ncbi:MAG: hypothetical protein HW390_80, partial [Candidatus Brocadiaceae bacterium]|nr:hypothetical protein [Candidatus Brocadiaceae bacterium]
FLNKNILHLLGRQYTFSLPKSYLLPTDSADEPKKVAPMFLVYDIALLSCQFYKVWLSKA